MSDQPRQEPTTREAPLARLLTVAEVAEALSVSEQTIRRLIHAQTLEASKVGGVLRVRPGALHALLETSRVAERL